jgi:Rrf2 family protein
MRLSKKAEYALRAVVAMGRRGRSRPMQIQELSEAERIPVKFLEQILLELKKGNLLTSKRGVGGGYQLNHSPEEIALGDVIELIDGPFVPASCAGPARPGYCGCGQLRPCGLGSVFDELQREMNGFLQTLTVAEVITRETAAPSFEI